MANELIINYPTGATLYALLFDSTGQIWNGSSFVAPGSASWIDYDIAMSEVATATGVYLGTMPAAAAGVYGWTVRKQAGGTPAVADITVGVSRIEWTGTAEIMPASTTNIEQINSVLGTVSANVTQIDGETTPVDNLVLALGTGGLVEKLNSTLEAAGVAYRFTAAALAEGPSGSGLTAQETADAVNNLAPAGASGAAGSIRAELDAIKLVTDAIDTSAVTVTAANDAGVLTVIQSVTFGATISGLTISGTWAKLYWTLKESIYDDDDQAILQLVESNPGAGTDGLLYLDSAAIVLPITVADGTLTVNQAGGTVVIAVSDNATALLSAASDLVWDVKTKDAAGATVQNTTGTASIVRAVTQTI